MPVDWLQITLTPSRHPIHSKTEMSYTITQEYSQEYFQPIKNRQENKNIQPQPEKNNILTKNIVVVRQMFAGLKELRHG